MEDTKIEWATHTFNPWRGCVEVSPACDHCYARTMSQRNPSLLGVWGDEGTRVVAAESYWVQPLKWNEAAAKKEATRRELNLPYLRPRVFCLSLGDVFEEWKGPMMAPTKQPVILGRDYRASGDQKDRLTIGDVRQRLFNLIAATSHLDWLLLTKRAENASAMMALNSGGAVGDMMKRKVRRKVIDKFLDAGPGLPNIWVGVTVENQQQADERIQHLKSVPAAIRFLSMEPLLGPVDLSNNLVVYRANEAGRMTGCRGVRSIDWVIAGGESGHRARPMHPLWVRSIRDQCVDAGVPFHFKQWGEWIPEGQQDSAPEGTSATFKTVGEGENTHMCFKIGKKFAGRLLDGRQWNEVPKCPCSITSRSSPSGRKWP